MTTTTSTRPRSRHRVKTIVASRVVTFFSHAPDGDCRRVMRLARKGAGWAIVEERPNEQVSRVVSCKVKVGSEAEALALKLEARGRELLRIGEAIQDGRAYLDTFVGRRRVFGYNDPTGDCVTLNPGEDRFFSQRTFPA